VIVALLPVEDALARVLADITATAAEEVAIAEAGGRVLAGDVVARRSQPPFPASAMDGYAVRATDIARVPVSLKVTGEAAAGRRFAGRVGPGEAVRIFTGAPVPEGADTILIQEDTRELADGEIEACHATERGRHIRAAGLDFTAGTVLLPAGRELDAAALSLAAAANHTHLTVVGRPLVAILATGDELVPPGTEPGADQVVSSNNVGVAEIVRRAGGRALDLGIAGDSEEAIGAALDRALAANASVVVTIGGASVGEHDLVGRTLANHGMQLDFWKIAMRPGKPLMHGRLGPARVLGLPGNPVSALVCAHLFLAPLVACLGGRRLAHDTSPARLGAAMPSNGDRQDYARARAEMVAGQWIATPIGIQDSSMLSALAASNALIVRPPGAPAGKADDPCRILLLR
jgi:molybdopterin molybdotransferase